MGEAGSEEAAMQTEITGQEKATDSQHQLIPPFKGVRPDQPFFLTVMGCQMSSKTPPPLPNPPGLDAVAENESLNLSPTQVAKVEMSGFFGESVRLS